MERPSWAPAHMDVDRPSIARVYDYYLGGSHIFAADREFALTVLEAMPDLTRHAQENRAFLRRAVRQMMMRSRDRTAALFGDLTLVEPGVVQMPRRRPDSTDDLSPDVDDYPGFAGVGRRDQAST